MMAGFEKLKLILAGEPGVAFASDEYMQLYTYVACCIGSISALLLPISSASLLLDLILMFAGSTIYNMCTQKPANDYSQQLYERYKELLDGYITVTVVPSTF